MWINAGRYLFTAEPAENAESLENYSPTRRMKKELTTEEKLISIKEEDIFIKPYSIYYLTNRSSIMKEENTSSREELKRLAKESTGALSWIKLSEPLEKRLERIEKEISQV